MTVLCLNDTGKKYKGIMQYLWVKRDISISNIYIHQPFLNIQIRILIEI